MAVIKLTRREVLNIALETYVKGKRAEVKDLFARAAELQNNINELEAKRRDLILRLARSEHAAQVDAIRAALSGLGIDVSERLIDVSGGHEYEFSVSYYKRSRVEHYPDLKDCEEGLDEVRRAHRLIYDQANALQRQIGKLGTTDLYREAAAKLPPEAAVLLDHLATMIGEIVGGTPPAQAPAQETKANV